MILYGDFILYIHVSVYLQYVCMYVPLSEAKPMVYMLSSHTLVFAIDECTYVCCSICQLIHVYYSLTLCFSHISCDSIHTVMTFLRKSVDATPFPAQSSLLAE